jgi:plasmanylethanolamine desaturase
MENTEWAVILVKALIELFLGYLAADFVAGLVHFSMDNYGSRSTPLIGGEIGANRRHHIEPRLFLRNSWWKNARSTLPIILALAGLFYVFDFINVFSITFLIVGWNANEVHKWSHQTQKERPRIVTLLQKWGVIQSVKEHNKHHSGLKDSHYCTVSPFVNPILEKIGFWNKFEVLIYWVTGARKVVDDTLV